MRPWMRSVGQVVGMLAVEIMFLVVLYWSRPYLGSVPLHHLRPWLDQTASQETLTAGARLVCIVAGWWLLGSTVAYLGAALLRRRGRTAGRTWRFVSLPVVRRLVEGALGVSMLASTVAAGAVGASAAVIRPPYVQTVRPVGDAVAAEQTGRAPHVGRVDLAASVPAMAPAGMARHLTHPAVLEHTPPTLGSATPAPLAPSAENGFAGLPAGTKVHVVAPGDCLSVIAERYLGDWRADTAIFELNAGQVQPNGHALTDAHWIYPGWVLVLPDNAVGASVVGGAPVAAAPAAAPAAAARATGPTPTAAAPAAAAPVPPAASRRAAPTPMPPQTSVQTPTIAPRAAAGNVSRPPDTTPAPAIAPRTAAGPVTTTPDTTPAPATAPRTAAGTTTTAPDPAPTPPTMVALSAHRKGTNGAADAGTLLEAGLLGAAVLGTVGVLRRRQAQHRPLGRRVRLPNPAVAGTELAIRRAETPDRVSLVERALASLIANLREGGRTPTILGVIVDDDSVEVLLAGPAPPPPLWTAASEGFRWRIRASVLPSERPVESAPLPALVSLGRVAAGRADALINLEAAGVVGVLGHPENAAGLLYALATHLIGAPWAKAVNIILVAFPPGLATPDNVRSVASLRDLAGELQATAGVMAANAQQHGCADAFTGRVRGLAADGWPPVVILAAQRLDAEDLRLLASVVQPDHGVAAVVVNAGNVARWEIDADAQPCPVNPLRLAVEPTVLDTATMTAISELIRVAEDTTGATLDDPPYDRIELSVERPRPEVGANPNTHPNAVNDPATDTHGKTAHPSTLVAERSLTQRLPHVNGARPHGDTPLPDLGQPPILVRVLGSVEVDGAAEFKRAKSRELVVYLAMHPNGVGESELDEALWGSGGTRVVLPSTRDATVSVARTAVGGAARLLPAQGQGREKRYQLGPEVQSDWSQFCALHRFGREHQSTPALRHALELIRGRPFEAVVSGRTYGWIHLEGHGRHIEAEVADAADLAASLYLEAGDPRAARWATRRGLLAEPYTERLWVRLMEAADALGESQEIERIMDEMDVILELEGDYSGLHPNTLAAYDRLSRRHRFPAAT